MIYPDGHLHLSEGQFNDELIPTLGMWNAKLGEYGVEPLAWFLFGSVVVKSQVGDSPVEEDPMHALASALVGSRPSNRFKPTSDIDVGLVVPDGHDEIELHQYDPQSLFRSTRVAGHVLSLTRFERSWVERRLEGLSQLTEGTPVLRSYGKIVSIDLVG